MFTNNRIRIAAMSGTALALLTGVAFAQPIEEVVVTGSHIRGVAPVGSTIISVGSDDLRKTGANSASDLLLKVPQFVTLGTNEQTNVGGSRIQGAAGNTTYARSVNLRGIGIASTLTLFNGLRITKSSQADVSDVDAFPTSLVERVEVVADGASAIYGSDAVVGTVNVVLKEPTDIIQSQFQVGLRDGGMDWQAIQTLGTTWDSAASGLGDGGIMLSYMHSYTDALDTAQRPTLYNDDLTPYIGAAGVQPTSASPSNVRGFTGGTANVYAVPAGIGRTDPVNLSQLGTANNPNRQSVWTNAIGIPRISRDTVGGVFKQELTDWLTFSAFGAYTRRSGAATYGTSPTTNSTVTVPNTNPYSPCRAGAPADTTHTPALVCPAGGITVLYAWAKEFQTSTLRAFSTAQYNYSGTFDVALPFSWHAKISGVAGKDQGGGTQTPLVNTTYLAQVLSGTNKPTNVPFFNPFCDNTAGPCNNQTTLDYIKAYVLNSNTNSIAALHLNLDGPLFDLPGGTVRLAVGAEQTHQTLHINNGGATSAAGINVYIPTSLTNANETVKSVFAELYVPVVGDSNAMPGIQKLELTLAGRITEYPAFGSTSDPKIGINWHPILGLKLHGTWGTSFKAPNLRENDVFASPTFDTTNTVTCANYAGINLAACPLGGASPLTAHNNGGGGSLNPETATTWTIGADWTPDFAEGLYLSASYYNLENKDRIMQPLRDAGVIGVANAGYFDAYVRYNPIYFPTRAVNNLPYTLPTSGTVVPTATQAEYNAFLLAIRADPLYVRESSVKEAANPVVFFFDGRLLNTGTLKTDGIDFQGRYDFDTDWGEAHVGAGGNYTFHFKQAPVPAAPEIEFANTFGANQRFRVRGEAGLIVSGVDITGYINHVGSYTIPTAYLPAAAGPQFSKIDSWTTFDLSVSYNIGEDSSMPLLRNVGLSASISNVFDNLPPFVLNGASATPILFDPNVGSPIGRLVTLRVSKNW